MSALQGWLNSWNVIVYVHTAALSKDSLGIPTSTGFNIHSYNLDNTQGVAEKGDNGIVPTALAIGLRETNARSPEAGTFKSTIVPVTVHSHGFAYWDQVKTEVVNWISMPIRL